MIDAPDRAEELLKLFSLQSSATVASMIGQQVSHATKGDNAIPRSIMRVVALFLAAKKVSLSEVLPYVSLACLIVG